VFSDSDTQITLLCFLTVTHRSYFCVFWQWHTDHIFVLSDSDTRIILLCFWQWHTDHIFVFSDSDTQIILLCFLTVTHRSYFCVFWQWHTDHIVVLSDSDTQITLCFLTVTQDYIFVLSDSDSQIILLYFHSTMITLTDQFVTFLLLLLSGKSGCCQWKVSSKIHQPKCIRSWQYNVMYNTAIPINSSHYSHFSISSKKRTILYNNF